MKEKILKIVTYAVCVIITVAAVCYGLLIEQCKARYYYEEFESERSTEDIATSQELEETTMIKEKDTMLIEESTSLEPTGTTSIHSVGVKEVVDKINAVPVVARCEWAGIELTQKELELLYTTVYCESGDQELEAQIMVAQTIINRIISDNYPDTLYEVVYQRNSEGVPQFAVINWTNFENTGWSDEAVTAVHYALSYQAYPTNMLCFRDSYYHSFGQPYKNVDEMFFTLM